MHAIRKIPLSARHTEENGLDEPPFVHQRQYEAGEFAPLQCIIFRKSQDAARADEVDQTARRTLIGVRRAALVSSLANFIGQKIRFGSDACVALLKMRAHAQNFPNPMSNSDPAIRRHDESKAVRPTEPIQRSKHAATFGGNPA